MAYTFVLLVGLAAGALSGIIGTGSSIMLLPILVYQFGPRQAVPIMAVAAAMSNIAKVMAWWRKWIGARSLPTRFPECRPQHSGHACRPSLPTV